MERVLSRALPSTTPLILALPSPNVGLIEKEQWALLPGGRGGREERGKREGGSLLVLTSPGRGPRSAGPEV